MKSFGESSRVQDVHIRKWGQGLPPSENCFGGSIEDHVHHTMGNILLHNNVFWFM